MDGIVAEGSKIVAEKGTKEKLSDWYRKHFDKNKEEDQIRNAISTYMDAKGKVGKALISVYAPELKFIAPIIFKKNKKNNLKNYDRLKKKIDKKFKIDRKKSGKTFKIKTNSHENFELSEELSEGGRTI